MDRLKALNLISPTQTSDSYANLLPLRSDLHTSFDLNQWTIYPAEAILKRLIAVEEAQLIDREDLISRGQSDPGRPSYSAFYAGFDQEGAHPFEVFFSAFSSSDHLAYLQCQLHHSDASWHDGSNGWGQC